MNDRTTSASADQREQAARVDPSRALAVAAGLVIVALTAAAFWLSYAHLAEVALGHGLGGAQERAWAWPATLDLFIVAGELLMLRAALTERVDWWAIGLTVAGSGGSIALNVAGVGTAADPLDYVVAAVPPTAALLAFGALMRQVHQALAGRAVEATPKPMAMTVIERAEVSSDTPAEVSLTAAPALPVAEQAPSVEPLVICGDQRVFALEVTPRDTGREVTEEPAERLLADAATNVIRSCWVLGISVADTARQATRSTSYVKKVFARLDEARGPQPMPGQMTLVPAEVAS